MKKIIFTILLLFILIISNTTYASEIKVDDFIDASRKYTSELMPELNDKNIIEKITKGEMLNKEKILERLANIFISEVKNNSKLIFNIIAIAILGALIKNIQCSLNGETSEIAFYVCYIFLVTLIITSYIDVIEICSESINKLNSFMNVLIPLVLSLLVVNGSIVTVGIMKPVLLLMTSIINVIVTNIILPINLIAMVFSLSGNISESISISKIPKLLQKTSIWCMEFMLILFVGILSLEGSLAANVDGLTAKTTKSVVSTVIPVVGKALSEAADSLIGATSITKNAVGLLGTIVIISIVAVPLIKVFIIMITYNIAAALIEPLVDTRISKCMSGMGESIKIIFSLMATISLLFIISTTIMIRIGNFSLMYR